MDVEDFNFLDDRSFKRDFTVDSRMNEQVFYNQKTDTAIRAAEVLEAVQKNLSDEQIDPQMKQKWVRRLITLVAKENRSSQEHSKAAKVFRGIFGFTKELEKQWVENPEIMAQSLLSIDRQDFLQIPVKIREKSLQQFEKIVTREGFLARNFLSLFDTEMMLMPPEILRICLKHLPAVTEVQSKEDIIQLVDTLFPFIEDRYPHWITEIPHYEAYINDVFPKIHYLETAKTIGVQERAKEQSTGPIHGSLLPSEKFPSAALKRREAVGRFTNAAKRQWEENREQMAKDLLVFNAEELSRLPADIRKESLLQLKKTLLDDPESVETLFLSLSDVDMLSLPSPILRICLENVPKDGILKNSADKLEELFPWIESMYPDWVQQIPFFREYFRGKPILPSKVPDELPAQIAEEIAPEGPKKTFDPFGTRVFKEVEQSEITLEQSDQQKENIKRGGQIRAGITDRLTSLTAEEQIDALSESDLKELQEDFHRLGYTEIGKILEQIPTPQLRLLIPKILIPYMRSLEPLGFIMFLKHFVKDNLFEEIPNELYRFHADGISDDKRMKPSQFILKLVNLEQNHLILVSEKIVKHYVEKLNLDDIRKAFARFPDQLKEKAGAVFEIIADNVAEKLNVASDEEIHEFFSSLLNKHGFYEETTFIAMIDRVSDDVKKFYYSCISPRSMSALIAELNPKKFQRHVDPFLLNYAEELKTTSAEKYQKYHSLDLLTTALCGANLEQRAFISREVFDKIEKDFDAMTDEEKLQFLRLHLQKEDFDLKPAIFLLQSLRPEYLQSLTQKPFFAHFMSNLSYRHSLTILNALDSKQLAAVHPEILKHCTEQFVHAASSSGQAKTRAFELMKFVDLPLQEMMLPSLEPFIRSRKGEELFQFLRFLHQELLSSSLKEYGKDQVWEVPPSFFRGLKPYEIEALSPFLLVYISSSNQKARALFQQLNGAQIYSLLKDPAIRDSYQKVFSETNLIRFLPSLDELQIKILFRYPSFSSIFEEKLFLMEKNAIIRFLGALHATQLRGFPEKLFVSLFEKMNSRESIVKAGNIKAFEELASLPPSILQALPESYTTDGKAIYSQLLSKTSVADLTLILQSFTTEQIRTVFSFSSLSTILAPRHHDIAAKIIPALPAEKAATLSETLQISPFLLSDYLRTLKQEALLEFVQTLTPFVPTLSQETTKSETFHSQAAKALNANLSPQELLSTLESWTPHQIYPLLFPFFSQLKLSDFLQSSSEIKNLPVSLLLPFLDETLKSKMSTRQRKELPLAQAIAFISTLHPEENHPLLEPYLRHLSAKDLVTVLLSVSQEMLASLPLTGIAPEKMRHVFQALTPEDLYTLPLSVLFHFNKILPRGLLPNDFFDRPENRVAILEAGRSQMEDKTLQLASMATEFRFLLSSQIAICPAEILQALFDDMMAMKKELQQIIADAKTAQGKTEAKALKLDLLQRQLRQFNREILKVFKSATLLQKEALLNHQDESTKVWIEKETRKKEKTT